MAIQFNVLDGTSGSISSDSYNATSKWYFKGTREELMAWLPTIGDNAVFSPPNDGSSTDLVWCPTGYKITDTSYDALNRFEYGVTISAGDTSVSSGGGYSFPNRNNLANEHKVDMDVIMFRITPKMCGAYRDSKGALQNIDGWDKNVESPFTKTDGTIIEIPTKFADKDTQIYRRKEILFLSGRPCEHTTEQQNFYHIETVGGTYLGSCWTAPLYTGIVMQNSMTSITDDKGDYWTQWDRAVDVAPIGLKWNVNYGHFIEV